MITVYSNPNCSQCEQTKQFLNNKGIEFESKLLQDSPEIWPLLDEKGYKVAPVVVTDTDSWSGFRIEKLTELVK